jgi:hypothetical protein
MPKKIDMRSACLKVMKRNQSQISPSFIFQNEYAHLLFGQST